MPKYITYPYTRSQLKYFKREIRKAGGFEELMFEKDALKKDDDMTMIAIYQDKESYEEKYLNGIYEPLRAIYNTEVPYVFWSRLYKMI